MEGNAGAAQQYDASILERVLVTGDLSKLSPGERLSYYRRVCESLGLNPLTRPFDYILLNGKLVLYAKRDATDQLRRLRKISVTITGREQAGDLYVVTARATDFEGRTDEAIGAVSVAGLKGDALANAIMKTETKAKRRVTLSICGLGWLDETEADAIADAGGAGGPAEAAHTDTLSPGAAPPPLPAPGHALRQQLFRAWRGKGLRVDLLRSWLQRRYGTDHTDTLTPAQLQEAVQEIQRGDPDTLGRAASGEGPDGDAPDDAEVPVDATAEAVERARQDAGLSAAQLAALCAARYGTPDWTALDGAQLEDLIDELDGRAMTRAQEPAS